MTTLKTRWLDQFRTYRSDKRVTRRAPLVSLSGYTHQRHDRLALRAALLSMHEAGESVRRADIVRGTPSRACMLATIARPA